MAIIRIKRTITTNLPTGLTFGELAFVQGNGATANRLYIQTNDAGVSVWIGAEILNSPTYWSGDKAETTVPTVSAVEGRIDSKLASSSGSGVTGLGATAASWLKLSTSFVNAYRSEGATGFVNILGATWASEETTNTTVGSLAAGTNLSNKTVFEILQKMMFQYQTVTLSSLAFSNVAGNNFTVSNNALEIGQTLAVAGSLTNISASATNNTNINANNGYGVTYGTSNTSSPASGSSGTIMGYTAWGSPKNNITIPVDFRATTIGASVTFRASAAQYTAWLAYGETNQALGVTASTTRTYNWWAPIYWGKTLTNNLTGSPVTYNLRNSSGNVVSGGDSRLIRSNPAITDSIWASFGAMSFSATDTSEYLYIWVPSTYNVGAVRTVSQTGTILAVRDAVTPLYSQTLPEVSVTNPHGVTTTYKRYLINAPQTSDFSIWLSYTG